MPSIYLCFLLVVEALGRLIHNVKREGKIGGVKVSRSKEITHTLFVDDVLLFGIGAEENIREYASLLDKYKKAKSMLINIGKSSMNHNEFMKYISQQEREIIPYLAIALTKGFKYSMFFVKSNSYSFQDWARLYKKFEAQVSS